MKAIIHMSINIPFEVSDNGYLGDTKSSIKEHIQAAIEELTFYEVGLKRHTEENFTACQNAKVKLERVELIP